MLNLFIRTTGRKLVLSILFLLLFPSIALLIGLEQSFVEIAVLGFFAGMAFPDLDVITGLIRTTFHTMVLLVLMGFAVLLFPYFFDMAQNYCPISFILSLSSSLDPLVVCKLMLAVVLMAAAYFLSWAAIFWIPQKDAFHHWTSAIVMSASLGMLNHILHVSQSPWPISCGFFIGYALHLLADSPSFDKMISQKSADKK
jgi:hypothetical protein